MIVLSGQSVFYTANQEMKISNVHLYQVLSLWKIRGSLAFFGQTRPGSGQAELGSHGDICWTVYMLDGIEGVARVIHRRRGRTDPPWLDKRFCDILDCRQQCEYPVRKVEQCCGGANGQRQRQSTRGGWFEGDRDRGLTGDAVRSAVARLNL